MSSPLPSDWTGADDTAQRSLVTRVRMGDAAALDEVFSLYAEPMRAYAHSIVRSNDIALELVQDVFLAIWRQRMTWRPTASIASYLFQAVRNRALNVMRHERHVHRFEHDAPAIVGGDWPVGQMTPVDETYMQAERSAALAAAIAELPPRVREVLRLVRDERRTYAEAAKALRVSVTTIERDLGRAVDALRRRLAAWG